MSKKYIPFAIILFYGVLYALTMPSGITWAYDSADGGDFLAAIATGGVPHPSGYPTYLLFLQLFSKIPFGSLAFSANIFSLLSMLLTIFLIYQLVLALSGNIFSASVSSLLFASFPLVWSQAIVTEVYALQALLFTLALCFFFKENYILGGITMGLLLGNHITGVFLVPIIFLDHTFLQKKKRGFKRILKWFAGILFGLSVYLLIPIRAQNLAPVNWGRILDWEGFWWLISGAMYQDRLLHISGDYLLAGTRLWSELLLQQLGLMGLFLGLFAIIYLFKPTKLHIITIWIAVIYSSFSIIYFSPDSYVYLIPVLLSFAIWIGQSSAYFLDKISKTSQIKNIAIIIILLTIMTRAMLLVSEMDISTDLRAEQYAQSVLASVPKDAMIIVDSDEAFFSLGYFHFAEELRPDVAIISQGLFTETWYRETLRDTYPGLNIPDADWVSVLIDENSHRPSCFLPNSLEIKMDCTQ